ncbi:uncharacterized protein A1O9_05336 [Exophiala aquamarina CBS 119918]|uniref:Amidase domain-containing protein n=1 Tax=Exophiala aquamarina CBS 119918 TaxID=1182545 RepID=A0A072PBE2_9EURO|nr:uncharacterized protein A1O9_05336 [Exophiala aquamarina CBS 119918]KEF57419.1 hypothetical protein A1O9_05336 [Exophiala aquamarina CBS 119918]
MGRCAAAETDNYSQLVVLYRAVESAGLPGNRTTRHERPDGIDVLDTLYEPINGLDRENHDMYEPSVFEDAPVGVQLVGRSMQEEQLLAVVMAFDKVVKA